MNLILSKIDDLVEEKVELLLDERIPIMEYNMNMQICETIHK